MVDATAEGAEATEEREVEGGQQTKETEEAEEETAI